MKPQSEWSKRIDREIRQRSRARFDLVCAIERRNRDERYAQASEHEINKIKRELTHDN